MKNRTLITLGIALAAIVMLPMVAMAQADDTATLTITGTVPSIVVIGFDTNGADGSVDLVSLTDDADDNAAPALLYAANVPFNLSVESANATEASNAGVNAVLQNTSPVTGFDNVVPYTLDVSDGATPNTNINLSGGSVVVYSGVPAGVDSFAITIDADNAADALDLSTSGTGGIDGAGTYQDILTFTVTAAP